MHGRGNWQFFAWGTGFWKQLWLFQVSKRCLLDMYKDNPVTRKVKNKYELNGQQDSLKLNACKSSESNERIGKWWRKKDKLVKFSYSTWERKQLRSVVRVLSEVTACQTILQVLVVQQHILFLTTHWQVTRPWTKGGGLNGCTGRSWWNEPFLQWVLWSTSACDVTFDCKVSCRNRLNCKRAVLS